jgi:hypothetical protein
MEKIIDINNLPLYENEILETKASISGGNTSHRGKLILTTKRLIFTNLKGVLLNEFHLELIQSINAHKLMGLIFKGFKINYENIEYLISVTYPEDWIKLIEYQISLD